VIVLKISKSIGKLIG